MMNLIFGLLIASMLMTLVRLVRGPSLPDRVVALDLMALLSIGVIAAYSVAADQPIFLDGAVVLALIAFMGTVAYAYFIEKGALPWRKS
jgi:multicomponent Na+:H+ antiporter subunit F